MQSLDFYIFIVPKPAKMNLPEECCLTPGSGCAPGRLAREMIIEHYTLVIEV